MEPVAALLGMRTRIVLKSRRALIALTCSLLTSVPSVVVLVGWQTHNMALMSIVPGFITMKANTAIAFLVCSHRRDGAFTLAEKLRETTLKTSITEFGFAASVS